MLNKFTFYICMLVLFGCNSGNTNFNTNPSLIKKDTIENQAVNTLNKNEQHIDDSTRIADSLSWVDPDTVFSAHAMNIIDNFPEIKLAWNYIDSASKHKRIFVLILQGMPSKDKPYYEINGGELSATNDSNDHFVPYMHFEVYRQGNQPLIKYYNVEDDTEISLKKWREKENKLKKEGKKDWFFIY